jgi:uncharacterized protein
MSYYFTPNPCRIACSLQGAERIVADKETALNTRRYRSADAFLDVAGKILLQDEVRHSLGYGIAERVADDPKAFGAEPPWFLTLDDGEQICAAVICTPPHRAIVSYFAGGVDAVASQLVNSIAVVDPAVPGVVGDRQIADPFAQLWCSHSGRSVSDSMAQRIYTLTDLIKPQPARGCFRPATVDDADTAAAWAAAFNAEAVGEPPSANLRERTIDRIRSGYLFLWDDDGPVSMAASTRPTAGGISIGAVYTPPEHRGRGYATSCVASLCEQLLLTCEFCVLYTDLSNPTSNAIYKAIGFREHCDSVQHSFSYQAQEG